MALHDLLSSVFRQQLCFNSASIVAAADTYGLPVRIRCDQGVEIYDVAMYMLHHHSRGPLMKPVIVGRSVHNQRIERLWRDVYVGITSTLFCHIEQISLLDALDDIHLFCLHYHYKLTIIVASNASLATTEFDPATCCRPSIHFCIGLFPSQLVIL